MGTSKSQVSLSELDISGVFRSMCAVRVMCSFDVLQTH